MEDREEVNSRILDVFCARNISGVGGERKELLSCEVCGEGISLDVVELGEDKVKVLLEALLVPVDMEDPTGDEETGKGQRRMCANCSAAVTSLVDLFLKLEELGRTFNEVRRRVGHQVLVGSLGGRPLKGYAGWVEEVRSVEDLIPSRVKRRLRKTKGVGVGPQKNNVKETETSDSFAICGLEQLEEVKEEFEEVVTDDFNEALDFCDFLIAPDEEPQSIKANKEDTKLTMMSPVVVLKRGFEGSEMKVDVEDMNEEVDGGDDDFLPSEDDFSLSDASEEDDESEELSDVEFVPEKRKRKLPKPKVAAKLSKTEKKQLEKETASEPKPKNKGGRPPKYPGGKICLICNRTFQHRRLLQIHMKNAHPGGVKRIEYPCPVCEESFDRHAVMRIHVRQNHPEIEPPENPLKEKWAPLDPSHPRPHKCPSCPKSYSRRTHLNRHVKNNHTGNPSKITRRLPTAGLNVPKNSEGPVEIACDHCDLIFTEEIYFRAHQLKRHFLGSEINDALKCRYCWKFFTEESSLNRHIRETHRSFKKIPPKSTEAEETEKAADAEEPEECGSLPEKEDKETSEGQFLEQPINIHCFLCRKLPFKCVEELETHVTSEKHRATVKSKMNVHCNLCRLRFGSDTEVLRTHLNSQEHLDEFKSLGDFNRETFCIPCRVECGSRKEFVEHSRTMEHKRNCAFHWDGDQLVKRVCARRKPRERLEVPDKCRFCGSTFDYAHGLQRHMDTCHREGGIMCEFCGKTFALSRDLKSHRKIHNIPKPFVCEKCGKTFEKEQSLKNHLRKNHLSQNLMCHECGKIFPCKESLTMHEKTVHPTEESNWLCPCVYCPEVFKKSSRLRRHYYTAHPEEYTKEAPHVCLVCFHTFATAEALNDVHMAAHDGLKCPTCGKYFGLKCHLTRHIRSHTGERPFACNFCGKRFATGTNLKEHLFRHTGEKPHVCSCGKGFLRNSILEKHKLKEKCV